MRREPAPSRGERWISRLGDAARTELLVLRTTFFVAWLVLAIALAVGLSIENAGTFEGAADAAAKLALAGALGVYYALFPATFAALGRLSWRLFRWGTVVPVPLVALGLWGSFHLLGGLLTERLGNALATAQGRGQCGGHGAGALAALVSIACVLMVVVSSPAGLFLLLEFLMVLGFTILLGVLPGLLLGAVLALRHLVRRVRTRQAS